MCGSCGKKYQGLSGNRAHRQLVRYRKLRGGKKEVVPPPVQNPETKVSTEEKKETE